MYKIIRYYNRRLYDPRRGAHLTLDKVAKLIQEGQQVVITCKATGDDVTRHYLHLMAEKSNNLSDEILIKAIKGFPDATGRA